MRDMSAHSIFYVGISAESLVETIFYISDFYAQPF